MLIVLSPAKKLDYAKPVNTEIATQPDFIKHSAELIAILRQHAPDKIASLMRISDQLATLNANRYAEWSPKFTLKNSRQAMLAFNGDVYEGLDANSLNAKQLAYTQAHIRILSGLYGVLRPLDLMQAYRLEMGTKLVNSEGKDLYAFWGDRVTTALNERIAEGKIETLVNLASEEYFKVVKPALLDAPVVTPVFQDWKNGKYKIISFYAKRARGMMARYAAVKGIRHAQELKSFDVDGYAFDASLSNEQSWIFKRRIAD